MVTLVSAADPPAKKKAELGVVGYLGSFQTEAGAGAGLGVGLDQRFGPHLIGTLELGLSGMDYDVPVDLGPFADDEVDVSTLWVGYLLKGALPTKHVELSLGAGPVLGFSKASVRSEILLFFSGTVAEAEDHCLGFQGVAGLDFRVGERRRLGFEYRRLKLDVDFGELSGGSLNVGGDAFLIVYRKSLNH
jgi:hypothetical protein